jgi:ABC-type nitrate/sulfonate/bicarbonate transport system ATPase subunit
MTVMVDIRSVHKSAGPLDVLKGIDLAMHAGEVTVIVGPSGSGKSTLPRTINHLEKACSSTNRPPLSTDPATNTPGPSCPRCCDVRRKGFPT